MYHFHSSRRLLRLRTWCIPPQAPGADVASRFVIELGVEHTLFQLPAFPNVVLYHFCDTTIIIFRIHAIIMELC